MIYIILFLCLIGIIFGANSLVDGSSAVARRFNISDFVIGALIVGIGTSMPELVVSLIGIINGSSDIAVGNVIGSNIFNILGILGFTALIFPIKIKKLNVKFDIIYCMAVSVLLTLLVFVVNNGIINIVSGVALLIVFGIYTWVSFLCNKKTKLEDIKKEPLWRSILKIVGGLSILIISCDYFIENSIELALNWGLNESVISLTLIACGTSLPELAASVVAAFKKNTDLALGNIIGSNIFNITFILGACSLVSPLNATGVDIVDYLVMIGAVFATLVCGVLGKINRLSGGIMLAIFIAYTYYLIAF